MGNIARIWRALSSSVATALVSLCLFWAQNAQATFEITDAENKVIGFTVEGDEFRGLASYPDDSAGEGLEANARKSHADRCAAVESTLPSLTNDRFVSFECGEPENIASRSNRRHFRSDANLILKVPFVKSFVGEKIEGLEVLADDYRDQEFKWQYSREVARQSYRAACEAYQNEMLEKYNASLLYVHCGEVAESGLKDGWKYYSTPTVFVISDEPTPDRCGDHAEGEKWWSVDYENPIRETVNCSSGSGTRTDIFHRNVEYQCLSGVKTATGQEKKGKYVDSEGDCGGLRDCGDRSHGEYWYRKISPPIEHQVSCPRGGSKIEVYERLEENSCFDGQVRTSEIAGDYIETIGSCADSMVCVNGTYHGDTWFRTDWNNPIYERRRCQSGGHTTNVYEREVLMRCDYGTIINTRVSTRGRLIDSYGRCRPPVRHCSNGRRHGERWDRVVSPPIRKRVSCRFGGSKVDLYQRVRTRVCRHGSVGTVGGDRPGSYLGSRGQCNPNGGKGNVGRGKGNKGKGNIGRGNGNRGNGNVGRGNRGNGNRGKGNVGRGNKGKGNKGKGNVGRGKGNKGKGNVGRGKGNRGKGNVGRGNKGNKGKGNVGRGKGNKGKGNVGRGKGNRGKGNVGRGNKGNKGKGNVGRGKGNKGKGNVGRGKGNRGKGNVGRGKGNRGKGNVGRGKGNRGKGNVGRGNRGNRGKGNVGRGNRGNRGNGNVGRGNRGNRGNGNVGRGNNGNRGNGNVGRGNRGNRGNGNVGRGNRGNRGNGNVGRGNRGGGNRGGGRGGRGRRGVIESSIEQQAPVKEAQAELKSTEEATQDSE